MIGQPDRPARTTARTWRCRPSGDALVVWDEDGDANGFYNIGLVRLARANGAVDPVPPDGQRRSAAASSGTPAVAANFAGDFAVAWESDHTGTRGRLDALLHRHRRRRGTPTSQVSAAAGATAPGGRHRRPGQRRSSAGPCRRRPRRLGPRLQPGRHRPPAACRPRRSASATAGRQDQLRARRLAVGRDRRVPTPTTTTATSSTRCCSRSAGATRPGEAGGGAWTRAVQAPLATSEQKAEDGTDATEESAQPTNDSSQQITKHCETPFVRC